MLAKVPSGLVALDYLGTAAFAASGCLVAGQAGMDTLGCCFVGTITALGGGTVRDVLLGRLPVFWFKETSFLGLSIATCLATFFAADSLEGVGLLRSDALFVGDTIGLGAFAVVGAQAAINSSRSLAVASVCGMLTATCGGLVRDVLCSRKNQGILYSGEGEAGALYAPTALVGAGFYGLLTQTLGLHQPVAILLGVGFTIALRGVAAAKLWRLPPMKKFDLSIEQQSTPQPQLLLSQAHLFVTAYGPDRLGHVAAVSQCISRARANVSASKIITIGDDIAFMMVVSAPSDIVESLAKALTTAGAERGLCVNTSRIENVASEDADALSTRLRKRASGPWRARVQLIGVDSPGLVNMVATFLEKHELNIQSMDSRVYSGVGFDHAESYDLPETHAPPSGEFPPRPRRPPQKTLTENVEMRASRGLRARADGDQFCLSAIVSTDHAPDLEEVELEIERLQRRYGVRLVLQWLSSDGSIAAAPEAKLSKAGPTKLHVAASPAENETKIG